MCVYIYICIYLFISDHDSSPDAERLQAQIARPKVELACNRILGGTLAIPSTSEAMIVAQRVQVPNIYGLWSQKPFRVWFLGPESLNIGYLDPLRCRCRYPEKTQLCSPNPQAYLSQVPKDRIYGATFRISALFSRTPGCMGSQLLGPTSGDSDLEHHPRYWGLVIMGQHIPRP